jgi:hypothetical protein
MSERLRVMSDISIGIISSYLNIQDKAEDHSNAY